MLPQFNIYLPNLSSILNHTSWLLISKLLQFKLNLIKLCEHGRTLNIKSCGAKLIAKTCDTRFPIANIKCAMQIFKLLALSKWSTKDICMEDSAEAIQIDALEILKCCSQSSQNIRIKYKHNSEQDKQAKLEWQTKNSLSTINANREYFRSEKLYTTYSICCCVHFAFNSSFCSEFMYFLCNQCELGM